MLDFLVGAIWVVAGIAFAVFLGVNGASVIEIALVVFIVLVGAAYWAYTSWALDWWRERR